MQRTNIPWTEFTWNVGAGCTKVSDGCRNCYACELHTLRHKAYLAGKKLPKQYAKPFGEIQLFEGRLTEPLHKRKPCMIFVNSMTDLFHPTVPFEFIDKVMAVIALNPQHIGQILTKRPERMEEYFGYDFRQLEIQQAKLAIKNPIPAEHYHTLDWPLPNLWLGTTVENNKERWRVDHLLNTPAAVRFLSLEPLLEDMDLSPWIHHKSCGCLDRYDIGHCEQCNDTGAVVEFDWVIVGAESKGSHLGRECPLENVIHVVEQCREASVSVFVKQVHVNGKLVKDFDDLPEAVRIRQMPGKAVR